SHPELRIGGIRINPASSGPSRASSFEKIQLKNIRTGEEKEISNLPENPKLSNISFSDDEKYIAFTHRSAYGISLWVAEVATMEARRLAGEINQVYGRSISWLPDNQLLVKGINPSR